MKERRDVKVVLVIGIALALAGLGALLRAPLRNALAVQVGVHLAAGREAAIPAGLGSGLSWQGSAIAALWFEWSLLLLVFPVLVLLGERLHRVERVKAMLDKAEAFARRRPDAGVLMLGGLTLMPFLPIGALTSALIGETLGLPSARLLATLMGAELIANVTVALAAASVVGFFPDPTFAAFVLAGVVLVMGAAIALVPSRLPSFRG